MIAYVQLVCSAVFLVRKIFTPKKKIDKFDPTITRAHCPTSLGFTNYESKVWNYPKITPKILPKNCPNYCGITPKVSLCASIFS